MAVPVTEFVDIIFSIVLIILKGQYFIHENNNKNRQKIYFIHKTKLKEKKVYTS